jgi:hypothetical protein
MHVKFTFGSVPEDFPPFVVRYTYPTASVCKRQLPGRHLPVDSGIDMIG